MASPSKQQRAASVDEASARFGTLHIKDDIMTPVAAAAARLNTTVETVENDNQSDASSITHEGNANRRKSTRQSLMEVKPEKTLSMRQGILADRVDHLHTENTGLHYRLESLEKSVKFELANKQDVIQVQHRVAGDIGALTQSMNNQFAELMMQMRELKGSTASEAPPLVDANSTAKTAEKAPEKAPLRTDFALQSPLISHSSPILPARTAFPIQDARNQLPHRWNDDFNDRTQRFHRDDYGLNRGRSRSRLRSFPEPPATNPKPSHLQAAPVAVAIKQEEFKASDIGYFYPGLSEETHAPGDYVVSGKDIFYRDVYMFTQQVERVAVVKHEGIRNKLHLCLRGSSMVWFTSLDVATRNHLNEDPHEFCEALIKKYKPSNSRAFDKLLAEHYTVLDARKQRSADEYVQAIMRHGKACNIVGEAAVTFAWKNLDTALRKDIRRPEKHVTADDFVELLDEVIEYYGSLDKHDEKEAAYQRGLKTAERRIQPQPQQSQQRLTTYPARQEPRQERNQVLPPPQTTSRGFQPFRQYPPAPPNQKLLTNQAEARNVYFAEERDNTSPEDEAYYSSPAETRYPTTEYAQFGDTATAFHAQAPHEEDFNSEGDSRNGMPPYSCNICQVSYPDDYRGLDNHMFDIHQIDINSNASMERKRYVNWMEHAALNVYEIKAPSNGYATFQARLFNNDSGTNESFICADTGSGVSFMDESLLPQGINLFGRLISTPPVTVRGISGERIVDKQIHLSIHVTGSDDIAKTIEATPYVTKGIKAGVILGMDVLGKPQNKITLHLHTKKMQLGSSHVPLNFTSPGTMPVSFNVAITALRSCMKATTSKTRKKTVRFATETSGKEASPSAKLGRISQVSHRETTANSVLLNANWHRKCAFINAFAKTTYCPEKVTETPEWRRLAAPPTASTMPIGHHIDARPTRGRANKSYMSAEPRRRRLNQSWR